MKEEMYVIVTIRGWDGNRILGVFSNEEAARAAKDEYHKDINGEKEKQFLQDEEFMFDFVELNRSSCGSSMVVNSSSIDQGCTFRNHLYNAYDE